jgi:hypothetical protein
MFEYLVIAALVVFAAGAWVGYRLGFGHGHRVGTEDAAARISGFVRAKTLD